MVEAEPFKEREAWLWLIAECAFKPRRKRVNHVSVSLARGQLAHSTRFMARAWECFEAKVPNSWLIGRSAY